MSRSSTDGSERPAERDERSTPTGVGFALRESRINAGLELGELAERTGIESRYLRALEWERDDLLPDPTIRNEALAVYMREVGLDPGVLDRIAETTAPPAPEEPPPAPSRQDPPPSDPSVASTTHDFRPWAGQAARQGSFEWRAPVADDAGRRPATIAWLRDLRGERPHLVRPRRMHLIVVGAILAGILAVIAVDVVVRGDEPFDSAPDEVAASPAEPASATPVPLAPAPPAEPEPAVPAPASSDPTPPPAAAPANAPQPDPEPVPAPAPTPAQGAPSASPAAEAPAPQESADATPAPQAPGPAGPAPTLPVQISARGGDTWIQVRARSQSGRVLHEGILPAGSSIEFERRTLWVRTGAGAFTVIARGDERLLARDELVGAVDLLVTPDGIEPV